MEGEISTIRPKVNVWKSEERDRFHRNEKEISRIVSGQRHAQISSYKLKNESRATRYVDSMHPSSENFIPALLLRGEKLKKKGYRGTIADIAAIAPPAIFEQHVRRFRPFPDTPCLVLQPLESESQKSVHTVRNLQDILFEQRQRRPVPSLR